MSPYFTQHGYERASSTKQYVHILVAEKALGRTLPKGAEVHHVNEDRADNRNTNLVICENLVTR